VIIPFHNESATILLKTIKTILYRTPDSLLEEIVLVDDVNPIDIDEKISKIYRIFTLFSFSFFEGVHPKVVIIHNGEREGLIRSKVLGGRAARGSVLIFLEAHVEVNENWIQPLLQVVHRNPKAIAVPQIDVIPDTSR